ncbi:hypothetical protein OBBRIDRAFT_789097 [Obba rivulosa]|uniref:Sds3-like-domain-containing protein n=1 Tax=Obba rivulosa TaxID=1052685 RepID=A0A8E2DRT0_9APHY|nr:hypothetical protein OBBRIDRAFT_789097 [Obba rivulosa]
MPGSTGSLEPLSSPSPSPPPVHPPERNRTVSSTSNHSGAAGLDTDSELSELTEDDQEFETRQNGNDTNDEYTAARTNKRKRSGGIIPEDMWGWATKSNKKTDFRGKPLEEEEEEEETGPAKAMEEEEDEAEVHSSAVVEDRRAKTHTPSAQIDDPPEEEDDVRESEDDAPPSRSDEPAAEDDESGDEADGDDDEPDSAPRATRAEAENEGTSPDLTEDEAADIDDDDEVRDDTNGPRDDVESEDDVEAEGADDGTVLQVPGSAGLGSATPVDNGVPVEGDAEDDADGPVMMEVDSTAPAPALVAPINAAAAASSIMAGSSVVEPPVATPSPTSSRSASPSSRSPSPELEAEAGSDREAEPEQDTARRPRVRTSGKARKSKTRSRAAKKTKAEPAADADADMDADVEQAAADADEGEAVDAEEADAGSPEMELESDLQPAHRAEALDVLATIELKFALLRERLYVEKMEGLAWEEGLIADGTHPELLHLHTELSKRRDKRLELASRRRDYEVANVTKRRRLDEGGVWSWWKNVRDELQTEMLSETSRKKRRLERERRALERPQPVRRIPQPPERVPPPPSLREIIRSDPFGIPSAQSKPSRRLNARKVPASTNVAYPVIDPISPTDLERDMRAIFSQRRPMTGYDPRHVAMMNAGPGFPPQGYDPYMGMPILDGPAVGNRMGPPPGAFQHQHQQQMQLHGSQMQGPPMMQGFPGPGQRLPHHHSAPPGALPNMPHGLLPLDPDMGPLHRPASGLGQPGPLHMQQYAGGLGQGNLMRRSISPVPVQTMHSTSGPGMPIGVGASPLPPGFAGPKSNGWMGIGPPGPSHHENSKEHKRIAIDVDGRERERDKERDRERLADGAKARDRAEREREYERERERDQHLLQPFAQGHRPRQHVSQHAHSHVHVHTGPGQVGLQHPPPHHHHHHHHHVHHHHHPQTSGGIGPAPAAGPSGLGHVSPMAGLPPPNAISGPSQSPRFPRDFEPRRSLNGAQTELIELSSATKQSGASPHMSSLWKGEELPPDPARERSRGPLAPPLGPHERLMGSAQYIVDTRERLGPPLQGMQGGLRSPRNGPGPSTAPASTVPSRRSSWSAPDDGPQTRPSSSLGPSVSGPLLNSASGSQRHTSSRMPRSPSIPQPPIFGSPPMSNGRPLPTPSSPHNSPFSNHIRSPQRSIQPSLPPPQLPLPGSNPRSPSVHPASPEKVNSPSLRAFKHSPPSPNQPKIPSPRKLSVSMAEQPVGANGGTPISGGAGLNPRSSPPLPYIPPPSVHMNTTLPPPRLPSSNLLEGPSPQISSGPVAAKIVPVDGS